jgi:protein-disulfide isomerase
MLSHSRPGLTKKKLVVALVVGGVGLFAAALAIEAAVYWKLAREGKLDSLAPVTYAARLSVPERAENSNTPAAADVVTEDNPSMGNPAATVKAVEFVDFGCPYSKDESSILRELVAAYPDDVWVQIRDFPIEEMHPGATLAAMGAACAGEQGKYWAMHDLLFGNQDQRSEDDLKRFAGNIGADPAKFAACLGDPKTAARIDSDLRAGAEAGVRGTPTFFVNGVKIEGGILAADWGKIVSYFTRK